MMNAKFEEFLARLPGRDDIARAEMARKADAVVSQLTAMFGRLDNAARQKFLDLIVEEVTDRSTMPSEVLDSNGRFTQEFRDWDRRTFDPDEYLSGVREIERTGGLELKDFLHELEPGRKPDERVA
jgi:hypothetical protein